MAENTAISWCHHTWNPWIGCTKISPACDCCYAEALMDKRLGKAQWGNHPRIRTGAHTWNDPFRWQRRAERDGTRPFVFCASLADIFDNQVDPQWRADAFDVMRKTPRLVYLLLTKRPQNIIKLSEAAGGLPANAAIGTTIEDQERANLNVPHLLQAKGHTGALFTFVSCEPLLGPIDLTSIHLKNVLSPFDALRGATWSRLKDGQCFLHISCRPRIDWVITGGETDQGGHKARPTHPDWIRSLRDQAGRAGVPFHHKQNGEYLGGECEDHGDGIFFNAASSRKHDCWLKNSDRFDWFDEKQAPDGPAWLRVGKANSGRLLDGIEHNAFPELIS